MAVIFELRQIYSESRKRSSDKLNDLVYQNCVFLFFSSFLALYVVLIHLPTIMRGLTTGEFKNLVEKVLEPLRKSIDEIEIAFFLFSLAFFLLTCNLILFNALSTGCLAPLTPMVTLGSRYSHFCF